MSKLYIGLKPSDLAPQNCLFIEDEKCFNAKTPEDFAVKLRLFLDDIKHFKFLNHIELCPTPDLNAEEKERIKKYQEVAMRVRQEMWMALGNPHDSLLGLENFFGNLDFILKYPEVQHLQIEKPFHAVVVASGPSLDQELELLRKVQSKILILCVDASFKSLLDADICPHIVTAVERDDYSVAFFKNLPSNLATLFVAQPTIPKKIFDLYSGPIATVRKLSGPFLWLPMPSPQFWSGSSSAHLCYRLACYLGAQSVALIGQDLAYHPDTFQSHSKISDYPDWNKPVSSEDRQAKDQAFWTEGNTRERVLTMPYWDLFAHEYSMMVQETKVGTFNTSTLGRKIDGIPYKPFKSWMSDLPKTKKVAAHFPTENPDRVQNQQLTKAKIQDAICHLTQLKEKLQTKHADINGLYKNLLLIPHFLELAFEIVIRDYARTENLCFNAPHDQILEHRSNFLRSVEQSTTRVLDVLKSALI